MNMLVVIAKRCHNLFKNSK